MDENIISLEKKLIEELTTKKEKIEIELNKLNSELKEINDFLFKLKPIKKDYSTISNKTEKAIFLLQEMIKNQETINFRTYKNKLSLNDIIFSRTYYYILFDRLNLYYSKDTNSYITTPQSNHKQ